MKYPEISAELQQILHVDQEQKRSLGEVYFKGSAEEIELIRAANRESTTTRTAQVRALLSKLPTPSVENIGHEGIIALSVLAAHETTILPEVLSSFQTLYKTTHRQTYAQCIPSLYDLACIMKHKPQRYGVHWMFNASKQPFLYPVEDIEHIDERRAAYGLGPLRWPKSLAIPQDEQPWLTRPFEEHVMREPTPAEYAEFFA